MPDGCGNDDFALPLQWVDVWTLRTDAADLPLSRLEGLLAKEELDRADRFRFDHLRRDYILFRGSLRLLCSRYLHVDPALLGIQYGPNGKPNLGLDCKLRFNLSHSGAIAVFAFTWQLELGVDLEIVRDIEDIDGIVQRFFCAEEALEVLAAPEARRARAFYACWTRKEAFIKATGDGLSTPLDSFRVTLKDNEPVRLMHVNFDPDEARHWTLQDLNLDMPYKGAICYRAPARPLRVSAIHPSRL